MYNASSPDEERKKIDEDESRIYNVPNEYSNQLKEIIRFMLEKDPTKRPNIDEVLKKLLESSSLDTSKKRFGNI